MRILMAAIGVACLVAGFFAGKFTQQSTNQTATTISSAQQKIPQEISNTTGSKPITALAAAPSEKTVYIPKDCTPNVATNTAENKPTPAASNKTINPNDPNKSNKPVLKFTTTTELSNESVDELVPKPFNTAIKNMHGQFKEKYADFLAADTKSEWAENAENYLNDALNNGMLGNSLEINSIKCQAGLCEVRVYEREANTAMLNINKQLGNFTNYFQKSQMSTSTDENKRTYITYLMLAKDAK